MAVVFVTGATGFIGKELTRQLVKNGHTVLALVRSQQKWKRFLQTLPADEQRSCMAVEGDLRKQRLGLSTGDYQQVLQASVIVHAGVPMDISLEEAVARDVILQGAKHLLALAKEMHQQKSLEKLIHIVGYMSPFGDESGRLDMDVFIPTEIFDQAGGYEKYKFLSDLYLRQAALRDGMPLVVVNPSTVIGPRRTGSTEQTDGLGLVVNSIRQGKFPVLPWGREWWLPLLSVDDLATVITGIVESEKLLHQTYYALNGRESTPPFPDLIQLIAKELRMTPPAIRVPLSWLKKVLHAGGSRFMGVPANSMDFIIDKDLPLRPFQQMKEQKGLGAYEAANFLPSVVADLDYRLSVSDDRIPLSFQREKQGALAAYHKEGTGKPWVLLHGLFSEMSDLIPLAEGLKAEPVWLLDLPGFGRSPYHHNEKIMEGYIQAVVEAIHELPEQIHLVGHSFGGYLANEVAKRVPEKIETLYLLQPPVHAPSYSSTLKRLGKSPAMFQKYLQKYLTPQRLEAILLEQGAFLSKEEIPTQYVEKTQQLMQSPRIRKTHVEALAFFMREFNKMEWQFPRELSAHIIWGTRDAIYQLTQEAEKAVHGANGEIVRLELGHNFPISHPEYAAETLSSLRARSHFSLSGKCDTK